MTNNPPLLVVTTTPSGEVVSRRNLTSWYFFEDPTAHIFCFMAIFHQR